MTHTPKAMTQQELLELHGLLLLHEIAEAYMSLTEKHIEAVETLERYFDRLETLERIAAFPSDLQNHAIDNPARHHAAAQPMPAVLKRAV